jgi:hypothetical protein
MWDAWPGTPNLGNAARRENATVTQTTVITQPAVPVKPRPRIGPPVIIALLVIFYFGMVTLFSTQTACGNDFGGVFAPSARFVLAGRPLDMYTVRAGGNNPAYPNANGPVGEFAIAAVLWVGRAMNLQGYSPICVVHDGYPLWQDSIPLHMWVIIVFALLPLGIGYEIMRLLDRWQSQPLTGWRRFLLWFGILISPVAWDSMVYYGHYEQPMTIWLGLVAARFFTGKRIMLSGVLLGLALLCRSAGIFIVIPLALMLLFERRWRDLARFAVAGGGTVGAILLPFYLHDKTDLLFSLSGFRAALTIGDGSFWSFFRYTSLETTVQSWDSLTGIIGATLVCAAIIWACGVRSDEPALYAVICASSLFFPLTIKAIWGYYFMDPLIWSFAFLVTRPALRKRWWELIFVQFYFTMLMLLTEYRINVANPSLPEQGAVRTVALLESGAECVALLFFLVYLTAMVTLRDPAKTSENRTLFSDPPSHPALAETS